MQQGHGCSNGDCGCLLCILVARNSDSKSTWSPGSVTNTSLAHELWKVPLPPKSITAPSRPPPGLTGQKPPLSTWDNSLRLGGGWGNSDARYTPGKRLEGFVVCYQVSHASGWTVCPCGLPAAALALPEAGPSVPACSAVGSESWEQGSCCVQHGWHKCLLCPRWNCLCQRFPSWTSVQLCSSTLFTERLIRL